MALAHRRPYGHIKRFGNYELDLSAVPVPVTDDLTFEIEPQQEAGTIEADHNTLPEPKSHWQPANATRRNEPVGASR